MRTLVFCDDYWHPARVPRGGLAPLGDAGFELDWVENAEEWSAECLTQYPLLVLTKSNHVSSSDRREWATQQVDDAFLEHVRGGNGLLVIHSGLAGYQESFGLRRLMGGVFLHHPEQCQVAVEPKDGHPLTAGSEPFTVIDEHYFVALDDPQADIFLTTTSEHGSQPGGWTRVEGQGRVCVLSPGHNLEIWLHPSYQALLRNGLRWCSQTL